MKPRWKKIRSKFCIERVILPFTLCVILAQSSYGQVIPQSIINHGAAAIANGNHTVIGVVGSSFIGAINSKGFVNDFSLWQRTEEISTDVHVSELLEMPTEYRLHQNYPNPFNPTTQISFDVPKQSRVTISIFNTAGQLVRRLVDGSYSAGRHSVTWNGRDDRGVGVASGLYLYTIRAEGFVRTMKAVKLK